jgi:dihydroneopterin aldolase
MSNVIRIVSGSDYHAIEDLVNEIIAELPYRQDVHRPNVSIDVQLSTCSPDGKTVIYTALINFTL